MIPVHELRVGNYWNHKSGLYKIESPCEIAEAAEYGIGVELTPEVLGKCGFKKQLLEWQIKVGDITECFEYDNNKLYYTGGEGVKFGSGVKYFHQLQNLFFALTGTELTYTP